MYCVITSSCKGVSIKKTRSIVDRFVVRLNDNTWSSPMTMEGLTHMHRMLKKVASKNTSVQCYINDGKNKLKLLWSVGTKKNLYNGVYKTHSMKYLGKSQPDIVKFGCLLASGTGYSHDIGKGTILFQEKLRTYTKDPYRHEFISFKILQELRKSEWDIYKASDNMELKFDKTETPIFLTKGIIDYKTAIDFCVATHHGLIGAYSENYEKKNGILSSHYRKYLMEEGKNKEYYKDQYRLKEGFNNEIITKIQKNELRMANFNKKAEIFYEGAAIITRAMLIMADHVVSTRYVPGNYKLYANTQNGELNQDLNYHLKNVGDTAQFYMFSLFNNLNLQSLSNDTVSNILTPSLNRRFQWQDSGAKLTNSLLDKNGSLIFNCADTGTGKTKSNLKIAASLNKETRATIVLNLRSLTLQTGASYKNELKESELAVLQGNPIIKKLFEEGLKEKDCDGNISEDQYDVMYNEPTNLPEWMHDFCNMSVNREKLLSPPVLVSTIDYIINAGNPDKQGNHVTSLLRIASSDLIIDEIDSYDPNQLVDICRVIEICAMFNRNVICSSATINIKMATAIFIAYERGKRINNEFFNKNDNVHVCFVDNSQKHTANECKSKDNFKQYYDEFFANKYDTINYKTPRLSHIMDVGNDIDSLYNNINNKIQEFHEKYKHDIVDKHISIGLIRIANIAPAIELSRFLALQKNDIHYKVCCYHSNHTLIQRHYIEKNLDIVLNKNNDQWKDSIYEHAKNITNNNICFIVVATPVEEIGRDHQFDWGIIEPSSMQSIIQTSGRIQRHTNIHTDVPNISILNRNIKDINGNETVFEKPGYQYVDRYNDKTHKKTEMCHLLSLKNNKDINFNTNIPIFSSLRNSQNQTNFAAEDDISINKQLNQPIQHFFKNNKKLNKHWFYEYTLREQSDNINLIWYEKDVDELSYKLKTENRKNKKYPDRNDMVIIEQKCDRDWLSITYSDSEDYCERYNISLLDGLTVSILGNDTDEYIHDYSFGFYKMKKQEDKI